MILLTGANGQLGQDYQKLFNELRIDYLATDYVEINGCEALDITNYKQVKEYVQGKKIDLIINCAAYNDVDKAEVEHEKAYDLNTKAPRYLAEIAKELDAIFVTYSTDFVFDGEKGSSYDESDLPTPLSVYGTSKYLGEKEVLDTYEKVFVIRTSWVFGKGNKNFNKSIINWAKTMNELKIVDDQISAPTYSWDLAVYSWDLIKTNQYGLYHLSNNGEASKYDQAKYVLDRINWQGSLLRAKTADFNLQAARPRYSKLDNSKIEKRIGRQIPHWIDAIDRFLNELREVGEL